MTTAGYIIGDLRVHLNPHLSYAKQCTGDSDFWRKPQWGILSLDRKRFALWENKNDFNQIIIDEMNKNSDVYVLDSMEKLTRPPRKGAAHEGRPVRFSVFDKI